MSLRKQRECDCCGSFTQNKTLCGQCLTAGCDKKKKGEKCYLSLGAAAPKPHSLPPTKLMPLGENEAGKMSTEWRPEL